MYIATSDLYFVYLYYQCYILLSLVLINVVVRELLSKTFSIELGHEPYIIAAAAAMIFWHGLATLTTGFLWIGNSRSQFLLCQTKFIPSLIQGIYQVYT